MGKSIFKLKKFKLVLILILALICPMALNVYAVENARTTRTVSVRTGAGSSYNLIEKLPQNTEVKVLGRSGSWTKVSYDSKTGYIYSKYLSSIIVKIGVVSTGNSSVSIKSKASSSGTTIGKLYSGNNVNIVDETNSYYKIEYNNKNAYVLKKYVVLKSSCESTLKTKTTINVRKDPSTKKSKIGTLNKYQTIKSVEKCENGWYAIDFGSKKGYISPKSIKVVDYEPLKLNIIGTAVNKNTGTISIRSGEASSYSLLDKLPSKEKVYVLKEETGSKSTWTKIRYNNLTGYVMTKYLDIDLYNKTQTISLDTPVVEVYSDKQGKIDIAWENNRNIEGYNIYLSDSKDGKYEFVGSVDSDNNSEKTITAFTITNNDFSAFKDNYYKAPIYYIKVKSYVYDEATKAISEYGKVNSVVVRLNDVLAPLSEIKAPRYEINSEGIYINKGSKDANKARIMLTGDIMCITNQQNTAKSGSTYNFNKSFSLVKKVFSEADLVVGNLESILSTTVPYSNQVRYILSPVSGNELPHCNAQSTFLDALRYAGFDLLVTANNHIVDDGENGIRETLDNIKKYKFMTTGTFTSKEDKRYTLTEINGIKVAVLSYTEKFNNRDLTLSEEKREIMLNRYSKEALERDIKNAKAKGAEFIIVYNHWGKEYVVDYGTSQEEHAREIANSGADLIIGSHPHVVQKATYINTRDGRKVPIVYSMGNFISSMVKSGTTSDGQVVKSATKDTIILDVTLAKSKGKVYIDDIGYIPCYTFTKHDSISYIVSPTNVNLNGGIDGSSKSLLDQSEDRISDIVGSEIRKKNNL